MYQDQDQDQDLCSQDQDQDKDLSSRDQDQDLCSQDQDKTKTKTFALKSKTKINDMSRLHSKDAIQTHARTEMIWIRHLRAWVEPGCDFDVSHPFLHYKELLFSVWE